MRKVVNVRPYQVEWDEAKAVANERKHNVTFELASTVFFDPRLLTVPDLAHREAGSAGFPGALLAVACAVCGRSLVGS